MGRYHLVAAMKVTWQGGVLVGKGALGAAPQLQSWERLGPHHSPQTSAGKTRPCLGFLFPNLILPTGPLALSSSVETSSSLTLRAGAPGGRTGVSSRAQADLPHST